MSLIDAESLGLDATPSFATSTYSALYAFGDSLSDAGNIYTMTLHLVPSKPYYQGHFSNGITWVENLALDLGLPALKPSLKGGTDFAYGDAETGTEPLHKATSIDLPAQLSKFEAKVPAPSANALYTLSIGSNDMLDAIAASATNPAGARSNVMKAVANETNFVATLAAGGAKNFLIMNVPDLGLTPEETAQGSAVAHTATQFAGAYDAALSASLADLAAQDGLNLHVLDAFSLIDQAVADPAAYGFTNVTDPVWSGNYNNPNSGTLAATGAAQNSYLFFDQLHPTEGGHLALADAALQSLTMPALA
ncbi:MAG: SGNH/GDSL hydrolase family protein [Proteobacteria bacterium]|nr:SGNH/GDSL hydrolase family protein [Pseudomonadota bacterium]